MFLLLVELWFWVVAIVFFGLAVVSCFSVTAAQQELMALTGFSNMGLIALQLFGAAFAYAGVVYIESRRKNMTRRYALGRAMFYIGIGFLINMIFPMPPIIGPVEMWSNNMGFSVVEGEVIGIVTIALVTCCCFVAGYYLTKLDL